MGKYRKAVVAVVGAVVAVLALFDVVVPKEVGAAVLALEPFLIWLVGNDS